MRSFLEERDAAVKRKRNLLLLLVVCWVAVFCVLFPLLCANVFAGERVRTQTLCSGRSVEAGGDELLGGLDLSRMEIEGDFSVYVEASGGGTATLEYVVSWDGETWFEPSGVDDVAVGFTATSGPGSDGKDAFGFIPVAAPYVGVRATETGATDSVTISAKLSVR